MTTGKRPLTLNPDRLFPSDEARRSICRRLYNEIKNLPIISPHGHTDPKWFALNESFEGAVDLILKPDHYLFRMLYSQGIRLEDLGIPTQDGAEVETDNRKIWRTFAKNYKLFRGTPSRMWLDWVFSEVFELDHILDETTADEYFDKIEDKLKTEAFKPRALFDRYNIEALATTEGALDDLKYHQMINESDWNGNVITTYRPDSVIDPDYEGFAQNLENFAKITGEDTHSWKGYLNAHKKRREFFKQTGATATDHGFATARTANLSSKEAEELFNLVISGKANTEQADLFRGQMLTEMARMSLDDGLIMQIHPGSYRNHNTQLFERFGRDKGADIPMPTNYVDNLQPLLSAVGNEPNLTVILFTLDETNYARELAPLAGHYPALRLGPPWWFHDSPEGMLRFRQNCTETAGFYNTVGFNDDTRAFLSIPARHDVARRMDCFYLADLVSDHRLPEDEAAEIAYDLTYTLPKQAYNFDEKDQSNDTPVSKRVA